MKILKNLKRCINTILDTKRMRKKDRERFLNTITVEK